MLKCSYCKKKFRTKSSLTQHNEAVHLTESEKRLLSSQRAREKIQKKYASVNPKAIKFTKTSSLDSSISAHSEKDEKAFKKIRENREKDADTFSRGR